MKLRKIFKEAAKQVRKNGVNAYANICGDDDFCVDFVLPEYCCGESEDEMLDGIRVDLDALQNILDNHDSQEDVKQEVEKEEKQEHRYTYDDYCKVQEIFNQYDYNQMVKQGLTSILNKIERGIDELTKKASEG